MPPALSDGKRIVIALGGNALGNTPQEQLELVKHTAACIADTWPLKATTPMLPTATALRSA